MTIFWKNIKDLNFDDACELWKQSKSVNIDKLYKYLNNLSRMSLVTSIIAVFLGALLCFNKVTSNNFIIFSMLSSFFLSIVLCIECLQLGKKLSSVKEIDEFLSNNLLDKEAWKNLLKERQNYVTLNEFDISRDLINIDRYLKNKNFTEYDNKIYIAKLLECFLTQKNDYLIKKEREKITDFENYMKLSGNSVINGYFLDNASSLFNIVDFNINIDELKKVKNADSFIKRFSFIDKLLFMMGCMISMYFYILFLHIQSNKWDLLTVHYLSLITISAMPFILLIVRIINKKREYNNQNKFKKGTIMPVQGLNNFAISYIKNVNPSFDERNTFIQSKRKTSSFRWRM